MLRFDLGSEKFDAIPLPSRQCHGAADFGPAWGGAVA